MRILLLSAHYLGFVLWLGAGVAAMQVGAAMRGAGREETALLVGIMGRLYRAMVLPGALLTTITGLVLTLRLYGGAISAVGYSPALMVMQGVGVAGAALALGVSFPAVMRLARLDPTGPHAEHFRVLRKRVSLSGMVAGMLGLIALVAGAM
ncbi:MAG TPA: hypothetical protein VJK71_01665 [Gemmatimonadales bacterium]|nr:hypothetical protein [Gemmatimonadales bacterium]